MSNVKEFVIKNGVLKEYNGPGGDVTIPASVTTIGDRAFSYCRSLTSVTIPASVTSIGNCAFLGCDSLADGDGFVIVNGILFDYKGPGGDVMIPEGVTTIGGDAFWNCLNLTSVTIPASVTTIGEKAFRDCRSLTSVTIPASVTSIGNCAFLGCDSLADGDGFVIVNGILFDYKGPGGDVMIPEGVTTIGGDAFWNCLNLTSVTIPASVTAIERSAFSYCSSLTSVTIPAGVTSIAEETFEGCSSLTSMTIPEGVTTIGDQAFSRCSSLTSVTIPEGVTAIESSAFEGCRSLTSVTIPASVTSIGNRAFLGCDSLADSDGFIIVNGILFDYKGPGGDVMIPEGVTSIGAIAFSDCKELTSVTIPEGVTSVGNCAFLGCSSLRRVTIPEGVTSIESSAFSYCRSLTSVTIPEGVTSIESSAFSYCRSLTSVTIPEGVTTIGEEAFRDCSKLAAFAPANPKCKCGKNIFGWRMPSKLKNSAEAYWQNLTDGDLKKYVLQNDVWSRLDWDQWAKIFLARQSKTVQGQYIDLVNDGEEFGRALLRNLSKKPSAKECNALANFMVDFVSEISAELMQEVFAVLKSTKSADKAIETVVKEPLVAKKLGKSEPNKRQSVVEQKLENAMEQLQITGKMLETKLKECYSITLSDIPLVHILDGKKAPQMAMAFLLIEGWRSELGICPDVAGILEELDPASLWDCLRELAKNFLGMPGGNDRRNNLAFPICRYADEALMTELTKIAPSWRSSISGNNAPPLLSFRSANAYSDTRAAMFFADKYGDLERYAELRGTTEDAIRDQFLSDVGIDEAGGKVYDLGNQKVIARLQKDLSFLVELPSGKTAKSLPKKGADEVKYAEANADFSEMKKATKKIVKNRSDNLFGDFLSGRKRNAESWRTSYLHNPLLRSVAELLVWRQGGKTFTLKDGQPIDSAERPYTIGDNPIAVAHPMELKAADVQAWQKYFTTHGLKQPFEQIWEPVYREADITPDRYEGSVVGIYYMTGRDKHGIHSYGLISFSECFGFSLDDCELEAEGSVWRLGFDDNQDVTYTFGKFTFKRFTRRVNHIVRILDRMTIVDRIKKDDASIANLLPGVTLAQITEYIKIAAENNCVNVTALLLEYKNANFADFDPMEEFTLD